VLLAILVSASVAVPVGDDRASANTPAPTTHELGWLCVPVADVRVSQVAAFNRDARMLSIAVPRQRFHVERTGPGEAGRLCIPTIVKVGDAAIPPETLIFERRLLVGDVERSAQAELVITPESPDLDEVTLKVIGLADQWTERDGVATFSVLSQVVFPPRVTVTFSGEGDGPPPAQVFASATAARRFTEPCVPVELSETVVGNFGAWDERSGRVIARGVEPLRLEAGTRLSRCEGLALDTLMVAVARPVEDEDDPLAFGWFLIPRQATVKFADPAREGDRSSGTRYTAAQPLGGYHVCRQPTWTTAAMTDIALDGMWELDGNDWRLLDANTRFTESVPRGSRFDMLDERDSWALVRWMFDGTPRILAVPSKFVALPSGPAADATELGAGLCEMRRGVWRATAHNAQAFRVSQDSPGAELAGLWHQIPSGSFVLQLCQGQEAHEVTARTGELPCKPIYVGGAQGGPNERFVLVRYAGSILAVREKELRDSTSGTFTLRRERPWFWSADSRMKIQKDSPWVFGLGPGARLSFIEQDDFGWNIRARVQRLTDKSLGFEGGVGVGGDGHGVFVELVGGVQALVHTFTEIPVELRIGVLGKLDLRATEAGGLGFDVIGKAQFRWVNEVVPVNFEVGVNLGYGGTFGADGRGGFAFGMPIGISVELVDF
jgi:hypothetical protein